MPQMIPLTEAVTAAMTVGIWLGICLGLFCWLTFHAVEALSQWLTRLILNRRSRRAQVHSVAL